MPEEPIVVPNDTPYMEDRGIWRIMVTGSLETFYMHHFSVTLDTGTNLNFLTALRWIHSICRTRFDAGTKLMASIRSSNMYYEKELVVTQ